MADNAPGDIIYQDNPRSSTAQVVGDDDKLHGVQLVADTGGEVVYQDDPRSSNAMAYGSDGKLHRVQLVYNMSSGGGGGGGEVTSVNGKKGRVVLDANDVNAVPQYSTLPTASESNVGELAQYNGTTIPDVPATAVATQTIGSGLSDLSVDVETFIGVEQPSGAETVSFVASVTEDSVSLYNKTSYKEWDVSVEPSVFVDAFVREVQMPISEISGEGDCYIIYMADAFNPAGWAIVFPGGWRTISIIEDWGFTITGEPGSSDQVYILGLPGSTTWYKNDTTVDLAEYGISYSGTPVDGDTISVAYTPFVAGITNGYFYKSSIEYSDPVATISQTVGGDSVSFETIDGNTEMSGTIDAVRELLSSFGWAVSAGDLIFQYIEFTDTWLFFIENVSSASATTEWLETIGFSFVGTPQNADRIVCSFSIGLSDLAVNVYTFVEAEQPTQSGNTSFVADVEPQGTTYTTTQGDITITENNGDSMWNLFAAKGISLTSGTTGVIHFLNSTDCYIGPEIGTNWFYTDVSEMAGYGIIVTGTPDNSNNVNLSYTNGSTTWSKNGTTAVLTDYGISYSGIPADGDTLTVAYTAPAPIGYAWKQTDVQPSSGGGGSAGGIEWKTKVDLPAEYTGDRWGVKPYYTIAGGLPDGTYEFYFSTKETTDSNDVPLGEVIFKVLITIDNTNRVFYGKMGYVFDGNYMNDGNTIFGDNGKYMYNLVFKNGNDTILFCSDYPWVSDVFAYITPRLVPECFKLSAIKNVDTGDEYVATGAINLDGSWPEYTMNYSGSIKLQQLVNPPFVPMATTWTTLPVADFATKTVYTNRRIMDGSLHLIIDGSELIINFDGVGGNEIAPYSQEIIRATGIFEGCYLAYGPSYVYVMGVDTATAATLSGTVRCACGGSSQESLSIWFDTIPTESLTPLAQFGPQAYRLGTITADGVGNIVQYTGATNANYTNGYYYKANGTLVPVPASITFTDFNPNDVTVTVADADALVTALNNIGGWGEQWVRDALSENWTTFTVEYDFSTDTVTRVNWSNYGDMYQQDVLDCFAVSTTGSYSGSLNISFICNRGYTPAQYDVTNTSWDRIDVQPSSGGLPDQTGQSGKFLTTDGTDASWSDKPLVNSAINNGLGIHGGVDGVVSVTGTYAVGIGTGNVTSSDTRTIAIGYGSVARGNKAIAINGQATAVNAIQIGAASGAYGYYTNSDSNTFKVGNENGNYEMMSADGTIPEARLADTTNAQQGDVLTLDSNGNAVWTAPSGGSSSITVTLLAANWSNDSQTVNATGVTASNSVFIGAAPASVTDYDTAGVKCTAQGVGTLTFTCTTTPSNDLTVNVLIM